MKRRKRRSEKGGQSLFTRLYSSLGQRLGQQLFDEVRSSRSLRPRITPGKVAAAGIAAVVHGITLAFLSGGLFLIFAGSSPGYVIAGVFLLVLAITLRPRLGKAPRATVAKERIPELSTLIEEVRAALGAPRVHGILLSSDFNASTWKAGWRRRTYVAIGLPLLVPLGPQERVALIGHELGHHVNGDPRRGGFVGTALSTLLTWYDVIRPFPLRSLPDLFANAVLLVPATLARWTAIGLVHLIWRESQRAEYLADDLASAMAGSDAAIAALKKTSRMSVWEQALHTFRRNRQPGIRLFDQYRNLFLERPASEADRVHEKEAQRGFRLDATHPPNIFRIEFIRAHPHVATITLTADRSAIMDRELAPFEDPVERRFLDAFGQGAPLPP